MECLTVVEAFEERRNGKKCRRSPRYQRVPVRADMLPSMASRSGVYASGGVSVGLNTFDMSLARIVPLGRLETSSALSWELPPIRT